MKRYTIYGPGEIALTEAEKPAPKADDVLIKVAYSGICGTDLGILSGNISLIREGFIRYPINFGHEWSGVVEAVGEQVTEFAPGDRVVSDTGVTCGKCRACRSGRWKECKEIRSVGTVNCWDGSFAQYMMFPQRHLYRLPEQVSLEQGALIEPATIALAGIRKGEVTEGKNVLVVGTGAIGLSAAALAKAMGAAKVILSGRSPFKLDVGKKMGADVLINSVEQDVVQIVRQETGGRGADTVIETSGNVAAVNDCLSAGVSGGIVALIGFYETLHKGFDIDRVVSKALQLRGVMGEFGLAAPVIRLMAEGKLDLSPLITHRYAFDETIEAMKNADCEHSRKIKMMVKVAEE